MQFKDLFKKFISHGAVIYTCGSLFIISVSMLLSDSAAAQILAPKPFLCFALFSYLISLGSTLYVSGAFSASVARMIHAVCYNVGFLVFLLICGMKFVTAFIFTAVFAVIYTLIIVIYAFTHKGNLRSQKALDALPKKTIPDTSNKKKSSKSSPETYKNRFS